VSGAEMTAEMTENVVNDSTAPFLPLTATFGDRALATLFSERALVESWLEVERALAAVQAELGEIPAAAAAAIADEATIDKVDFAELREKTRSVGYPILPLIELVSARSSAAVGSYIHWGATTQDIMDTGLVLQIERGLRRIETLESSLAATLARLAEQHRTLPIVARTHAQQAVPTTFGAKLAVWLDEFCRHLERLHAVRDRVVRVQLFGAAGTAAALGPRSREVRLLLAKRLRIGMSDVPWHTARDGIAEIGFALAAAAGTCGKVAREIIDLSRTEIGELREQGGHDHGASSTMPQKANPILSEVVVGMSTLARTHVLALLMAMQPGHERSAGEWQVEWDALPSLFALAGGSLENLDLALASLAVSADRMEANLENEDGMAMAEAAMIRLAPSIGRLRAHHLVSEACRRARESHLALARVIPRILAEEDVEPDLSIEELLAPDHYFGEADAIVTAAIEHWTRVSQAAFRSSQTDAGAAGVRAPSTGSDERSDNRPTIDS
jgi:3-carboxy-cis,cis-muconate cycloisomerase